MKNTTLILILFLHALAWSQVKTGCHRRNQALARARGIVMAQGMPYATVNLTNTVTGARAMMIRSLR